MEAKIEYSTFLRTFFWFFPGNSIVKEVCIDINTKTIETDKFSGSYIKKGWIEGILRRYTMLLILIFLLSPSLFHIDRSLIVFISGFALAGPFFLFETTKQKIIFFVASFLLTAFILLLYWLIKGHDRYALHLTAFLIFFIIKEAVAVFFIFLLAKDLLSYKWKNIFYIPSEKYFFYYKTFENKNKIFAFFTKNIALGSICIAILIDIIKRCFYGF